MLSCITFAWIAARVSGYSQLAQYFFFYFGLDNDPNNTENSKFSFMMTDMREETKFTCLPLNQVDYAGVTVNVLFNFSYCNVVFKSQIFKKIQKKKLRKCKRTLAISISKKLCNVTVEVLW